MNQETRPDLNFGDIYESIAVVFPERLAIVGADEHITWREFDARSNRLARFLVNQGLTPNSKVAFYLRNSPAYVLLWNACAKGRFVHANVNYRYVDHELYYLLDNSDAEAVVYDAEFRPQVEALRARLPNVTSWIEVGEEPTPDWANSFSQACTAGDGKDLNITRSGDDLYFIYTGGTTGYPKGVMWPAKERIAAIGMTRAKTVEGHIDDLKSATKHPVLLTAAPMMHSTGLTTMMSCLVSGGTVVIPEMQGFDAEACLKAIETNDVTRLAIVGDAFAVPMLEVLEEKSFNLSSVEVISSAGAMWSAHHKQSILGYFKNAVIADALGSSEGSRLGSATTKAGEAGTTAKFKIGPYAKVFREDLTEVPPGTGEAGMLATSGPLPLGYYKDPEKTAETFPIVDGVRYSMAGDWVQVESDGTMTLLGRGNNCINTGGEKVYPEEVEEALKTVTGIVDAAVLGMPDEKFGQVVTALIKTSDGKPIDPGTLRIELERTIARYKHPKRVFVVENSFRHDNGKINYREAKQLVETRIQQR